jgi:SAM-dependent methyltransferase
MYQASLRGYEPIGFEISAARAEFGRKKLNLEILSEPSKLQALPQASIDIVYTSHALEHLPSLVDIFEEFSRLLRPGGTLLIFVPNCGGDNARRLGVSWGPFTNEAHTISFEASFFERNLPRHGFEVRCFSDPYDGDLKSCNMSRSCTGDELLVVAKRSATLEMD